jgi:hypothetical protein
MFAGRLEEEGVGERVQKKGKGNEGGGVKNKHSSL